MVSGAFRNVFILFREGFYCGLKCSGSFQRYREWSVRIRGFWVVYEWYPGEGFAVSIWFPELPGISSKCLEGVFMIFSSVPGVSGKYYTWVVVSGDL